jgi:hypothetical protein
MKKVNDLKIFMLLINVIVVFVCTSPSHAFLLESVPSKADTSSPEQGTRRVMPASYEETYAAFVKEFSSEYSVTLNEGSLKASPYNKYSAEVEITFTRTDSPDRTEVRMIAYQNNTPEVLRKWEQSVLKRVEARLISAKASPNTTTLPYVPPKSIVKSDVDELPRVMTKTNKNDYAIVIGIEEYRQKLPKADYALSDAQLVSEYLTKAMGYPDENVVLLTNEKALQSDLTKYFEKWLHNQVEKDSTVFIYYSGHGAPDHKTGGAYLVPYDGDPSFISETGYSLKRMYDTLGKLPAKEIIVILDSCFSGAGGRSVIAKGLRPLVINLPSSMVMPKNMTVMTASSGEQVSSTYDEKGPGLFTYFMLKGIKNEDVVKPDGSIKMDDLFGYIKPQVERIARKQFNNEQTPQLIGATK